MDNVWVSPTVPSRYNLKAASKPIFFANEATTSTGPTHKKTLPKESVEQVPLGVQPFSGNAGPGVFGTPPSTTDDEPPLTEPAESGTDEKNGTTKHGPLES